VSGRLAEEPRSPTLRAVLAQAAAAPAEARASLERALRASGGPLVEPLAGEPGRALVSFVATAAPDRPRIISQLFPGYEPSETMRPLPGIDGAWWAEAAAPLDAATIYQFAAGPARKLDATGHEDPEEIQRYVRALYESAFADPWNDERFYPLDVLGLQGAEAPAPPPEKWTCVVRLPGAAPFPWHDEPARRGRVETFRLGARLLGNSRAVSVWTPPGRPEGPLPLVVLLDGESFLLAMDAPRIFDNLVAGGAAPPFVAACVHNATPTSRLREYGCNPDFDRFLAEELVPELRSRYLLLQPRRARRLLERVPPARRLRQRGRLLAVPLVERGRARDGDAPLRGASGRAPARLARGGNARERAAPRRRWAQHALGRAPLPRRPRRAQRRARRLPRAERRTRLRQLAPGAARGAERPADLIRRG
jgi:hypothetical protein